MNASEPGPLETIRRVGEEARSELRGAVTAEPLAKAKSSIFGKTGSPPKLMGLLASPAKDQKREVGQAINVLKIELEALLAEQSALLGPATLASLGEDISLPGVGGRVGRLHPLTRMERRVVQVLGSLGFEPTEGPEIEDEFHNFVALNIPADHPARDESDNFYLSGVPYLLRSQTSTVQIRTMRDRSRKPPYRVCAPGRVFRPDEVDATHFYMFHQVEGLAIDRHLSMADLKATLISLFQSLLGEGIELRLRPSFFPFTEPSAEIDVRMPGRGWMEVGGSGMVDPAVLAAVGLDPEEWSGFAFGLGLERLAMRRFGVKDIRLFTENDLRFLQQMEGAS